MKKFSSFFLFLALLTIVATDFSGCGSSGHFKASAQENGKSSGDSSKKDLKDAPDVTFKDLQGKDVKLADLRGKVVVVNFWATWCEPCQIEIPWMIGFQQEYADKGFTLLGVAMDDEGKSVVGPYVEKTQFDVDGKKMTMNYPIVIGNDDLSSKFGGLIGLPTTMVVSRDGKIHKRFLGMVSHDELEKEIKELL
jgi:cytochrome c biogenesis protein CcmG/thiol:disulfide interchange protein DsbE